MRLATRIVFVALSVSLALAAMGLAIFGFSGLAEAVGGGRDGVERALLDLVGYLIVALAVFDVAKYLFEDKVQRAHVDRRAPGEARRSVTRILSTIIIAVLLEGLVGLFRAGHDDMRQSIYGVFVLLAGGGLLLALGVYQRLSASTEQEVGEDDQLKAEEARDGESG